MTQRMSCSCVVGVLGTGVPRLACLRRGSKGGPARPIFINTDSRPSRGASLVGQTTRSFLRNGLIRLAREEAERSRRGTSRGARDASHDDQGQAGAGLRRVLVSHSVQRGQAQAKASGKGYCLGATRPRLAERQDGGHRGSQAIVIVRVFWQARTNFSQDKCTRCSPSKWPIVGALLAHYLGRGPGPLSVSKPADLG